jgi:hypothetical protein
MMEHERDTRGSEPDDGQPVRTDRAVEGSREEERGAEASPTDQAVRNQKRALETGEENTV